jgi:methylenetetrahydrofolate dehydrogenase (NADP+)/methenyltetrahydrofolate cyclohydrolase
MKRIDGRAIADGIRAELKKEVSIMPNPPGLGVLLIGDDPASHVYVNLKEKAATDIGIKTDIRRLPATTSDSEMIRIIATWNADPTISGIIVQLPLPDGHDVDRIIAAIDPKKDADGFHPTNIAALLRGEASVISPVHEAVLRLIAATGIDPKSKSATIIANSSVFADPLAHLLQRAGFVTAIIHPEALNADTLKTSNVVITAVGRVGFIGRDLIAPGVILIDVGTSRNEHGKICGDADADALSDVDGWITPVPGGIGPMTVALLLKNVVAAKASHESRVTSEESD